VRNMDMNARLLPRKKEETKLAVTNNSKCHAVTVTNLSSGRLKFELSGRKRQDARPGLAKTYQVPGDLAWRPAVGVPFEQWVRHHRRSFGTSE
jgi:hypothetical protein